MVLKSTRHKYVDQSNQSAHRIRYGDLEHGAAEKTTNLIIFYF